MFRKYVSNVSCGTGNNHMLVSKGNKKVTARAYFKVECAGKYNYRFFFQNTVNSTFAQGEDFYVDQSGSSWTIHSARVGIGADFGDLTPPACYKDVTFDNSASKNVSPGEMFWSDEIEIDVPENKYLVWEWDIEGELIPCSPDSRIPCYIDFGEGFVEYDACPKPALVGCDKKVKKRIAFIGDSITQGCGTGLDKYEMWTGRIGAMLKDEYAVWNLGLGYSRGSDLANNGSLLYKAKQTDIAVLTYGVNDICSGKYKAGRPSTAGEIVAWIEYCIKELQAEGIEVILSTIPPFHYYYEKEMEWRCLNMAIPTLAKIYGCRVYDFEASLDASDKILGNDYSRYGDHPNGEGGLAAANKFRDTFFNGKEWTL